MTPEELVKILNTKTAHSWSMRKKKMELVKFEIKATKNYVSRTFIVHYEDLEKCPEVLIEGLSQKAKEMLA